jgi:hypothetical protein
MTSETPETESTFQLSIPITLDRADLVEVIIDGLPTDEEDVRLLDLIEEIDDQIGAWPFTFALGIKVIDMLLLFADEESDQSLAEALRDLKHKLKSHPLHGE